MANQNDHILTDRLSKSIEPEQVATSRMPPFSSVIKSPDVEDPVNVWVHRPLAYTFVTLIFRTPITPNHVTVMATLVGLIAAACWFVGSPWLMVFGGILLWSAAILDGADGILARAKNLTSEFGRAFDGGMDMVVATATCFAAYYHLWDSNQQPLQASLLGVATLTAVAQINLYDFYKESYLESTNPDWDGHSESLEQIRDRVQHLRDENAGGFRILITKLYEGVIAAETRLVTVTNPRARRGEQRCMANEETVRIYRRHNYWPMQLWALNSLAPHSYLLAIAGMVNRIDLYLWYRLVVGNGIFLVALIWQRYATNRTRSELNKIGASPVPSV